MKIIFFSVILLLKIEILSISFIFASTVKFVHIEKILKNNFGKFAFTVYTIECYSTMWYAI